MSSEMRGSGTSDLTHLSQTSLLNYQDAETGITQASNSLEQLRISSSGRNGARGKHSKSKDITPDTDQDQQYSADIKPIQFKMIRNKEKSAHMHLHHPNHNHKPHQHSKSANNVYSTHENNGTGKENSSETYSKVKARLHSNTNTSARRNKFEEFSAFNSIDLEQFESYLKEPTYIKTLKKAKGIKQFRRLFLAQELRVPDDNDYIPNLPMGENNNTGSNNNGSGIFASLSPIPSRSNSNLHDTPSNASTSRAIWSTKFSHDGKYLAAGGKEASVTIWKVLSSPVERWELDSSTDGNSELKNKALRLQISPNASPMLNNPIDSVENKAINQNVNNLYAPVFNPHPFRTFKEHSHDVLSLDWSKNNFLLSSSMDNSVKLWHPDRKNSLKTFQHPDFVTTIAFHPNDDRFFISGCLDHKCRLWSILDNEVNYEFDCDDLITSVAFSPDDGKYTIVGTFNGYIFLLMTRGLTPVLSFHVSDTSTHKLDCKYLLPSEYPKVHHGPRITGIECFYSEDDKSLRGVITSNDSRIRIFNLRTKQLVETLRGFHGDQTAHKAHSYARHGHYPIVISSSDDGWVYGWRIKSSADPSEDKETDKKQNKKSLSRSGSFKNIFGSLNRSSSQRSVTEERPSLTKLTSNSEDSMTIASNNTSSQKLGRNSPSLKLKSFLGSSSNSNHNNIKNSNFISFHAHRSPVTTATLAPPETSKTLSLSNDFICELSLEFFNATKDSEIDNLQPDVQNYTNPLPTIYNLSDAVDAIGTILVTTDNTGLIRVFRADISTKLRSRVLNKLREYKDETKKLSQTSTTSLTSLNRNNSFQRALGHTLKAHSYTNLAHLPGAVINQAVRPTLGKQQWCSGRSSSYTNMQGLSSQSSTGATRGSRSLTSNSSSSLPNVTDTDRSMSNISLVGLRCDVCNGTSFAPITTNNPQQEGGGLICKDCGTILNHFR